MAGTGDALKRVHSGERLRIPATAWNGMLGVLKKFQSSALSGGSPKQVRSLGPGEIWVKNDSGGNLVRSAIVGIDLAAPVFSPATQLDQFLAWPVVSGVAPAQAKPFVILSEPVASGNVGRACIYGVCPALVNVISSGHRFADLEVDEELVSSTRLASGDRGAARIIAKAGSSTGEQWCILSLGDSGADTFQVKLYRSTSDPGAAGDKTSKCTIRYQAWDMADTVQYCEAIMPGDPAGSTRTATGKYIPAPEGSTGLGGWKGGEFVLLAALSEVPDVNPCTPS